MLKYEFFKGVSSLKLNGFFCDMCGWSRSFENGFESVLGSPNDSVWLRESQDIRFLLKNQTPFLPEKSSYGGLVKLEASGVSSFQVGNLNNFGHLYNVDGVVLGLVP